MSPNPNPDSKVHGANMGPTWVLSAPDGPHVGPINLAIRKNYRIEVTAVWFGWASYTTCVTRAISTSEYKQHILVWSSLIQALSRGLMVLSHYLGLCCLNGHLDACEHISVKFVFFTWHSNSLASLSKLQYFHRLSGVNLSAIPNAVLFREASIAIIWSSKRQFLMQVKAPITPSIHRADIMTSSKNPHNNCYPQARP